MFIILNLRNIIENFQRYGTQFNNAPRDFLPLSLLIIMPSMIIIYPYISYTIERLKFKQKLSVKIAVMKIYYLEYFRINQYLHGISYKHSLLSNV